ncbi:MAG: L-serine ammonia-lyase, iron-sulfur-dependent, subunit alpha [Clostridia bacterium]|nr:L-serine ammonia-lyase, iron-sulfur-dependent, subunit alpha [Clostridia bacterium]
MKKTDFCYINYCKILTEELVPATGCTEPIAIAYCSAKARATLGRLPSRCIVEVSGNIIKNTKSVVVPNCGGNKGIASAVLAGILLGNADNMLNVLGCVTECDIRKLDSYVKDCPVEIRVASNSALFYISVTVYEGQDSARVVIEGYHTNIILIERNNDTLYKSGEYIMPGTKQTDRGSLTVYDILDFADTLDIHDVSPAIEGQIECNSAISKEGLTNDWGASVGKVLLATYGNDINTRLKAAAAAGSDARMSGCEMPVIIVSGSGNQGMTTSIPVIEFAHYIGADRDRLIRALVVSNLVTIEQKTGIGSLSAFCGAVSAGCGAAAGIAYLRGCTYRQIAQTITNTLAIASGMVCDGAKPSCAAKIATAVEAGILGYNMCLCNKKFDSGDGIVSSQVDGTIANISKIARGMKQTDSEILEIMTKC